MCQLVCAARNAGLACAKSTFVLFIDGAWITDAAPVNLLMRELEAHTNAAIVVPRFSDDQDNNHIGHTVRRFPTAGAFATEFLLLILQREHTRICGRAECLETVRKWSEVGNCR